MSKKDVKHPMASNKSRISKIMEGADKAKAMLDSLPPVEKTEEKVESPKLSKDLGDLKQLIFFGKQTTTVEFGSYKFEIQTLNNNQQKDLVSRLRLLSTDDRAVEFKTYLLSSMIVSVNDVPLENLYDGEELTSAWDKKQIIISNWQSFLVDALYFECEKLMAKANSEFIRDDLADEIKK
jgi:hypothetical protein